MTATVTGSRPADEDDPGQITVPAVAVFADESGTSHVWVVNQETMQVNRRKVTTGDLTGTDGIGITEGLNNGEMIAVSGVSRLREGMKVRAMDK